MGVPGRFEIRGVGSQVHAVHDVCPHIVARTVVEPPSHFHLVPRTVDAGGQNDNVRVPSAGGDSRSGQDPGARNITKLEVVRCAVGAIRGAGHYLYPLRVDVGAHGFEPEGHLEHVGLGTGRRLSGRDVMTQPRTERRSLARGLVPAGEAPGVAAGMGGVAGHLFESGIVVGELRLGAPRPLLGQGTVGDLSCDTAVGKPVALDVLQCGESGAGAEEEEGEGERKKQRALCRGHGEHDSRRGET